MVKKIAQLIDREASEILLPENARAIRRMGKYYLLTRSGRTT